MRPLHELTPKQFRERIIADRIVEYGVSREEASYGLTPQEVERQHSEIVLKAADSGIAIRREVLDAMGLARQNVLKWHSGKHPGYMSPEVRRLNREAPLGRN